MQKMLILGANGLVGKALIDEFKNDFDLYGTYASSVPSLPVDKQYKLDIHQIDNLKEMLRTLKPVIVISCLRGEFDQQLRFHEALAMELTNTSSRMYYFSTTNVFDGDFSKPHMETDLPISNSD